MKEVLKKLNDFAIRHKVILEEKGTCGFGRPCVGFLRDSHYIDLNPISMGDGKFEYLKEFYCEDFRAPVGVNNYHKHDCLAVLVEDDNYKKGLKELLKWIENIESKHKIEIVDRQNEIKNPIQLAISGLSTPTLKVKK